MKEIKNKFFPEMDFEKFASAWPNFCEMVGTRGAHQHLDDKIWMLEKYHPVSDLLYENIEEFISSTDFGSDLDIQSLTVREFFVFFHDAQNKIT